jgi:hypothetical protein
MLGYLRVPGRRPSSAVTGCVRLATPSQEDELARLRAKFRPSEKEWRSHVLELARQQGWRVNGDRGWPDLVLLRPPRLLVVELKADDGHVRPQQRDTLRDLESVAAAAGGALTVDVWRPGNLDRVLRLLRGEAA